MQSLQDISSITTQADTTNNTTTAQITNEMHCESPRGETGQQEQIRSGMNDQ